MAGSLVAGTDSADEGSIDPGKAGMRPGAAGVGPGFTAADFGVDRAGSCLTGVATPRGAETDFETLGIGSGRDAMESASGGPEGAGVDAGESD